MSVLIHLKNKKRIFRTLDNQLDSQPNQLLVTRSWNDHLIINKMPESAVKRTNGRKNFGLNLAHTFSKTKDTSTKKEIEDVS